MPDSGETMAGCFRTGCLVVNYLKYIKPQSIPNIPKNLGQVFES